MPDSQSKTRAANLNRELVLGAMANYSFQTFLGQYLRSLPQYVDDVERDFGHDIYERMLHDAAVGSSVGQITISVLSGGVRFLSRVQAPPVYRDDPEAQAKYTRAEDVRLTIENTCNHLQQPLEDILEDMLEALPYGHAVAEQIYETRNNKLVLTKLRVKPRNAYAFVVDQFMDIKGLIASKSTNAGMPSLVTSDVIPREKFFVFTFASSKGDPRGHSILRRAYNPWYLKQQVWPQYLKYLAQFGTPSLIGILPPDAADAELVDANGNVVVDSETGVPVTLGAADTMLSKLIQISNGTAGVFENGSTVNPIEVAGDGSAYTKGIDLFDRQITRAIMLAVRAAMESEHSSKADSETAQDTVGDYVQYIRRKLEVAFYRDVIVPFVRYNYGDEVADSDLCPYLSLSDVAKEDVVEVGNMIANIARSRPDMIHTSQLPGIDAKLGLPERDFETQMDEEAEKRDQAQMLNGLLADDSSYDEPAGDDQQPAKKSKQKPGRAE
ncbi:MAG: hypothetical protein ABFD54_11375 [Armatimonadota bacterium]